MGSVSSNKPESDVKWQSLWWLGWSLLIVLGLVLGAWQWQRAEEKRDYLARLEAAPTLETPTQAPPEGSEVHLQGHYVPQATRFLDNRVLNGRVGVAVLTPLVDDEGRWWLVERGFVPIGPQREDPVIDTPSGRVEVSGQWQVAGERAPVFGPNQQGRWLQSIVLEAWQRSKRFAHPGWLHQVSGAGAFASWWKPSVMPPSRHIGYAIQWWGLALAAAAVMVFGRRYAFVSRHAVKEKS
ncbi:Cytochrome oxidase assembly protein ShyY1 [Modicisalibacter muralis]|uniref:SURF1-like protein n=1 Tax=Modicisalibacter muralis TaxID=119000 RepID=A0A1G9G452_9GAMM|nr:SURF1 family protein [Halomonas muralis]SDK95464.1 Cytochrome oxidase assembly protein ShyY1 [Halomonas muralis]